MVAQPVTGTGGDTHLRSTAMPDKATGKRLRGIDPVMPDAATDPAAGAAPEAATLQQLTERVLKLEQTNVYHKKWWIECGSLVNGHGEQLDELQDEALQYNDQLHTVATHSAKALAEAVDQLRAYTNALGQDCTESLKVVEAGMTQMVTEYNSGFDKWRVDTKNLVDLIDTKVRDLEGKIEKLGSERTNWPNYHYIGTLKQKKVAVLTRG